MVFISINDVPILRIVITLLLLLQVILKCCLNHGNACDPFFTLIKVTGNSVDDCYVFIFISILFVGSVKILVKFPSYVVTSNK